MTDPNPIAPPDELVEQWKNAWFTTNTPADLKNFVATQAARWGADQELEACCQWLEENCGRWELPEALSAARRPQQPSLKERALSLVPEPGGIPMKRTYSPDELLTIRHALEQLPDDPAVTPPSDDQGPGSVAPDASPVATDEELCKVYDKMQIHHWALRAIYNLGREHGAEAHAREQEIVRTGEWLRDRASGREPAAAPGEEPLWVTAMMAADCTLGRPRDAMGATLRVVADWMERMGDGTPWMEASEVFATSLRAEAERAEAS